MKSRIPQESRRDHKQSRRDHKPGSGIHFAIRGAFLFNCRHFVDSSFDELTAICSPPALLHFFLVLSLESSYRW